MEKSDWARIYAAMDRRVDLKYQQLPIGEQIGKASGAMSPETKKNRLPRRFMFAAAFQRGTVVS